MTRTPDEIKKGLDCCADGNLICAGNCVFDDDAKLGFPDCVKLLMTNALTLIQRLEAQVPRWISVEERLPKKGVFVVVYYGNFIGNLMDVYMWDGECWRSSSGYLEDAENITHWMPLPEPPKEEKP